MKIHRICTDDQGLGYFSDVNVAFRVCQELNAATRDGGLYFIQNISVESPEQLVELLNESQAY